MVATSCRSAAVIGTEDILGVIGAAAIGWEPQAGSDACLKDPARHGLPALWPRHSGRDQVDRVPVARTQQREVLPVERRQL